jgi:type VI secretion system protein ImpM
MDTDQAPGFFGKVPAVGDFVSRRLPRNFLDPWDQWLQSAIVDSQTQLAGTWLEHYLSSPIWRFALSEDVAGPFPCSGIMMPSVDKSGRYFPLTVVTFLPVNINIFQVACNSQTWFDAAESAVLSVLDEPPPDMESWDKQIIALGLLKYGDMKKMVNASIENKQVDFRPWHLPIRSVTAIAENLPDLVRRLIEVRHHTYSLWWSSGSERINSAMLISAGLPPATGYAAMLGGDWYQHGWYDLSDMTRLTENDAIG